jgi:hypothetical protein
VAKPRGNGKPRSLKALAKARREPKERIPLEHGVRDIPTCGPFRSGEESPMECRANLVNRRVDRL